MDIHLSELMNDGAGAILRTTTIQSALDRIRDAGGGTLRIPSDTHVTGIVEIHSHTTLHLEKGARLLGSPDLEDHRVGEAVGGILFARDAENITIEGAGTIDGNAASYFLDGVAHTGSSDIDPSHTRQARLGLPYGTKELDDGPLGYRPRPGNLLVFARCRNVVIRDITITGATYWTLHIADCEQVRIKNLTIANDPRHPNNDGIHVTTSRHVAIAKCHVTAGDDGIAITGFKNHAHEAEIALGLSGLDGECADIEIHDCELSSRSTAIRCGFGENPVRRVHVRDCRIHDSNRGVFIQATQADVEDIVLERIAIQTRLYHGSWWGNGEPVSLSAVRFPGRDTISRIRNVTLKNIAIQAPCGIVAVAEEPGHIDKVSLENVTLHRSDDPLFARKGGNIDLRPCANPALAVCEGGVEDLLARNTRIEGSVITAENKQPT